MTNAELARNLELLADLSELDGANSFSVRAYRNAAATVRALEEQVASLLASGFELTQIKGIGKEIAAKLRVMVETGQLPQIAALLERVPVGLLEVVRVKGVGAKQARALFDTLGVASIDDLEAAAKAGRIAGLSGFGAKTQERILKGIDSYRRNSGRMRISEVDAVLAPLLAGLRAVPGVERLEVAGSYRRRRETVGDIDLLAVTSDRQALSDALTHWPDVRHVLGQGETKTSVELGNGLQVDMRIVEPESFGAALLYFTGSKEHGVALRQRALERGWHLNEYGLFEGGEPGRERVGGKRLGGASEEEIYQLLDMAAVPPELREHRGEVEAAAAGRLPELIALEDIRGDLHMHSTWSDGVDSVRDMVLAARTRGYEYVAITDHSAAQAFIGGLGEEKLAKQHLELDELDQELEGITLLRGLEVDVLKDGTLDLSDEWLAKLDVVIVSVHSHMELGREEQTARLIKAVSHPEVNILAHPTARTIGDRDPIDFDLEAVLRACLANGVAVELNAAGKRLDLSVENLEVARRVGVTISIGTDAHAARSLGSMALGVSQARRAWIGRDEVLNTRPLAEVRRFLAKS